MMFLLVKADFAKNEDNRIIVIMVVDFPQYSKKNSIDKISD